MGNDNATKNTNHQTFDSSSNGIGQAFPMNLTGPQSRPPQLGPLQQLKLKTSTTSVQPTINTSDITKTNSSNSGKLDSENVSNILNSNGTSDNSTSISSNTNDDSNFNRYPMGTIYSLNSDNSGSDSIGTLNGASTDNRNMSQQTNVKVKRKQGRNNNPVVGTMKDNVEMNVDSGKSNICACSTSKTIARIFNNKNGENELEREDFDLSINNGDVNAKDHLACSTRSKDLNFAQLTTEYCSPNSNSHGMFDLNHKNGNSSHLTQLINDRYNNESVTAQNDSSSDTSRSTSLTSSIISSNSGVAPNAAIKNIPIRINDMNSNREGALYHVSFDDSIPKLNVSVNCDSKDDTQILCTHGLQQPQRTSNNAKINNISAIDKNSVSNSNVSSVLKSIVGNNGNYNYSKIDSNTNPKKQKKEKNDFNVQVSNFKVNDNVRVKQLLNMEIINKGNKCIDKFFSLSNHHTDTDWKIEKINDVCTIFKFTFNLSSIPTIGDIEIPTDEIDEIIKNVLDLHKEEETENEENES